MATTDQEYNFDLGIKAKLKKGSSLLGINYFNFQNPMDKNGDNFTDLTLQNRISIFNKWNFIRKENRLANVAARLYMKIGGVEKCSTKINSGEQIVFMANQFILLDMK
jgi:outer membrane receptor for ferrienterochelin and colicins